MSAPFFLSYQEVILRELKRRQELQKEASQFQKPHKQLFSTLKAFRTASKGLLRKTKSFKKGGSDEDLKKKF